MSLPVEQTRHYSIEDYFRIDAESEEKHEYWDGFVVPLSQLIAMAGGTFEHSLISTNFIRAIGNRMEGGACRVMGSDLRIKIPRSPYYFYPDASVICGQPQFDPQAPERTTALNPRVVAEVLSPSTESYDSRKKLLRYFQVPTLEEYVLISQAEPRVDSYFRHADGSWSFNIATSVESNLVLQSLKLTVPLKEIYANVEFPPEPPPGG